MLTISAIKNGGGAASYYAKEDNYYLSEADAKEASEWWGKGAEELGLGGKVEINRLKSTFGGKLPNEVTIGLQQDGTIRHRAGFDLCFHAPKSVSILALVGEDKRFYEAHLNAVKETLKVIEENCAEARVFKGKNVSFENTKNLTVALIKHTTSRELDPHLHHHALVMNVTKRQDNTWRALASNMTKKADAQVHGFFEKIYKSQIYYGLVYKHALANKIVGMGYEIESVGTNGLWEIKGVPKEARDIVSKRRKIIEARIENLNYKSMKAADMATLDTRENKPKNIRLDELKKSWHDELAHVGFSAKEFLTKHEKNKGISKPEHNIEEAKTSIKDAIEHLSRYNLKLEYIKIISQALEFSIGKTTHKDIVREADKMIQDGLLIPLDKSDAIFVTKDLIDIEKTIMNYVGTGKKANCAITLKNIRLSSNITDEIKNFATDILCSKERLSLIESNKNNIDLVAAILELAEASGKTVRVLSPSRAIANNINENIKRKPNTLWQWLISSGKPELGECVAGFKHRYQEELNLPSFLLRFKQGKDLIIVDNTEMLGCKDLLALLELTEKSKAKLLFLRDISAASIGAGNSIKTLKQAGIETFSFNKKPDPLLFSSNVAITPIKDDHLRIKQVAKDYVQKEILKQETVVLVSSKNRLSTANKAIREELKSQERLLGIEHEIFVLNPVAMSQPEATLAHKYRKNMVVRIYRDHWAPEDWRVKGYNRNTNTLRLAQGKRKILWNPKKEKNGYAVFKQETLQIAEGDKLIATSSMRNLGIKNGARFVVSKLDDKYVELSKETSSQLVKNSEKGLCEKSTPFKNTTGQAPLPTRKSTVFSDLPGLFRSAHNDEKTIMQKSPKNSNAKVLKVKLANLKNSHFQYNYASTIGRSLKKQVSHVIADIKSYTLDKPTVLELTKRTKESLVIFTDDSDLAQKRLGHIPIKLTATETVLEASQITRIINDETKIELKSDLEKALDILKDQYALRKEPANKAVDFALEKITSRNAGFSHKDLMVEALKYVLKNNLITKETIEKVIAEKHASGELITGRYLNDNTLWTTKEMLELEKSILSSIKQGIDKLEPIIDPKIAKNLVNPNLTKDQQNAATLIATTRDQYVIVQGYAGTGKTTLFKHIQSTLKETGVGEILALAPTHKAVIALKNVGLNAQTLKSFLIEQQTSNNELTKLIVLDEASMVSNKDFAQFSKIVGSSKAHVVLSGDIAQHLAIEAGKPLEMTQKSKISKTAYLREIVRQKNPNLKAAVESTIAHDYQSALTKIEHESPQKHIPRLENGDAFFKKLTKSIIEVDSSKGGKNIELMVAEDYLSRTPEIRDNTVVIVHTHEDRATINKLIRDGLKTQGVISANGIKVDRLTPKRLTNSEHKFLESYNTGDILKFGKGYYHVKTRDKETKSILLQDTSGKTRYFYPQKDIDKYNVELYSHTKEELAVGDKIRLTKTDKKRGLYANFEYRVKEINGKQVVLVNNESNHPLRKMTLDAKSNHYEKNDVHFASMPSLRGALATRQSRNSWIATQSKKRSARDDVRTDRIILDHKKLKNTHWDYAHTVTGYGIQSGSEKYAIDFEVSYRKQLANQRSFYIGASRAIWHLAIYTDSKEKLLKNLYGNPGDKYTALEVARKQNKAPDVILAESSKQSPHTTGHSYDAKEIAQLAASSAEVLVEKSLGQPSKKLSSAHSWRYGNKGSLVINMESDKRGLWHNFETGESGNILTLIQKNLGLSFKETLQYVSNALPSFQHELLESRPHESDNIAPKQEKTLDNNVHNKTSTNNKTTEYAQRLAQESSSIVGTIVEKYLTNRGINNLDSRDIRYHPKVYVGKDEKHKYLPAMLALGRDIDGNICCVQATYLDPKTANKADIDVKKRTYGSLSGVLVSLDNNAVHFASNEQLWPSLRGALATRQSRDSWIATQSKERSARDDDNTVIRHNSPSFSCGKDIYNDKANNNKTSFIAEGIETGLSVRDAIGSIKNSEILVTLGKSNFANIDPKRIGDKVIFCLDNDGLKTLTDSTIHKAAEQLISANKEVFITLPHSVDDKNIKIDFNDIAKTLGIDAVKNTLNNAVPYKEWKDSNTPNLNNSDKIIQDLTSSFIEKALQKDYELNGSLYDTLPQKPEFNLDAAVKLIDLEQENSLAKDIAVYSHIRNDLHIQDKQEPQEKQNSMIITNEISTQNTQKFLAKTQREIY